MAAGYDGSIRINTKGDATGFNNLTKQIGGGLYGITKSLKGVAAAAGIAFGVGAIINFSKASVKAATDLTNAMMGLRSIMEGQGRSFQQAQKFINDYVSDGLIPATQAITAYKNLALRGYDDSQIKKVLVALKDSAAFGRQASYSLGEAVESATEGLKNENSILVDNAGVTKNVAKMWDEYAKSIGTTANNLTQQQKIQAEVMGILEESKYQVGDAAKVATSYSGEILKLGYNFNNLKIAIGNALIPIARAVLPSINAMIAGLTKLANVFAQVSALIFAKQAKVQEDVASSGVKAAKAENSLAKATEKAGKAAKGALANFDELNVLTENTAAGAGGLADALTDAGGIDASGINTGGELFGDVEVSPKVQEFLDNIKESLKVLGPYVDRVKDAWDRLKQAFMEFINTPAIRGIIGFLEELFAQFLINRWAGALAAWAGVFDIAAGALKTLAGFMEFVVGVLTGDWARAWEGWNEAGYGILQMLQGLGEIVEGVFIVLLGRDTVEAIKTFISEWSTRISKWWNKDVAPWFTKERWSQLWNTISTAALDAWNGVVEIWLGAGVWFDGTVITPIREFFEGLGTSIAEVANLASQNFVQIWGAMANWFNSNVVTPIANFFGGLWTGIKAGASTLADYISNYVITPIVGMFKGLYNSLVGAMTNVINGFVRIINSFIMGINSMLSKIRMLPGLSGMPLISTLNAVSIPKLATGAVIPPNAEFLAVLGDQRHGRNLEAPEGLIRQIIQEELSGLGSGETTIRFEGSMGQLIRVLKPHIDKEDNRRGKNLIKGAPVW